MSDVLSGNIEAHGINPKAQFNGAASSTPAPLKPYVTFPVKPDAVDYIVKNLDRLKGRTDDSEITAEKTPGGGTRYSFIDNRTHQPLAVMNTQNGQASMILYKSPEKLAERIDSAFVQADDIRNFIAQNRADTPTPPRIAVLPQPVG